MSNSNNNSDTSAQLPNNIEVTLPHILSNVIYTAGVSKEKCFPNKNRYVHAITAPNQGVVIKSKSSYSIDKYSIYPLAELAKAMTYHFFPTPATEQSLFIKDENYDGFLFYTQLTLIKKKSPFLRFGYIFNSPKSEIEWTKVLLLLERKNI